MRRLFNSIRKGITKWSFQKADLAESTEVLNNPVRGWYRIYSFMAEDEVNFETVSRYVTEGNDSLAFVIINIGAYRDKPLDESCFKHIKGILRFFVHHQLDIILRITYDHEGKALEREPFFFKQVIMHLEQLVPVLKEFSQNIFVYQGLLIGNWGEMHTSRFMTSAKLNELWSVLKTGEIEDIFFAVRKPAQWRSLHMEGRINDIKEKKMGLFDDAIFGSESHLGTFGMDSRESAAWDGLWSRPDELDFEDKLCISVPNGGEVLSGEEYLQKSSLGDTIAVLKKMHITYLNRLYDRLILSTWSEWKWEEPGVWQGSSVYDYIGNHLGYRFWIKDVVASESRKIGNEIDVKIFIENVGFANLYQDAELHMICEDEQGHCYERKIDTDMRTWKSGEVQTIETHIKKTSCHIYLTAMRKRDGRPIYFANQSKYSGSVLLGKVIN